MFDIITYFENIYEGMRKKSIFKPTEKSVLSGGTKIPLPSSLQAGVGHGLPVSPKAGDQQSTVTHFVFHNQDITWHSKTGA
jgi:hypothetical protein